MPELSLANAVAAALLVSFNAYVRMGGADFGGGVWDLFSSGPRRAEPRALIADAIGPIWEANHVWLILAVVLLFTCFPAAFSDIAIGLHIPLTLMLIGIVLRGSAFTFRTYARQTDGVQRRWGRLFAAASLVTPLLLGSMVGAIASGRLGTRTAGTFASLYVRSWLDPFCVAVGALTLALFAFLAAVYLTVEAKSRPLPDDFRRRALWAAGAVFVSAWMVLPAADRSAPQIEPRLRSAASSGDGRWRSIRTRCPLTSPPPPPLRSCFASSSGRSPSARRSCCRRCAISSGSSSRLRERWAQAKYM